MTLGNGHGLNGYRKIVYGLVAALATGFVGSYGMLWTLVISDHGTTVRHSTEIAEVFEVHKRWDSGYQFDSRITALENQLKTASQITARLDEISQRVSDLNQKVGGLAKDVEWMRSKAPSALNKGSQ